MTVTVTIEELREFESKMYLWGRGKVEAELRTLTGSQHMGCGVERLVRDFKTEMTAYEKENPIPRLIPNV